MSSLKPRKKNKQPGKTSPNLALAAALRLHQAGNLEEAAALYRAMAAKDPENPGVNHLLGVLESQQGRKEVAESLLRRAITAEPRLAEAHNNLGVVLCDLGRFAEAIASYRSALAIRPDYVEALQNLGNVWRDLGETDEAIGCYRKVLELAPDFVEALNNLGAALNARLRFAEALGWLQKAVSLNPGLAEARYNLGKTLAGLEKPEEAVAAYRRALSIRPEYVDVHISLGSALDMLNRISEAAACYRKALILDAGHAGAWNNLGNVLKDQGNIEEAIDCYRRSLALAPDSHSTHSNLLLALNYLPALSKEELFGQSKRWDGQHAAPAYSSSHGNSPENDRRLKVGYVSPDFRNHPVACFFETLLRGHNRENVEVFCYSDVVKPDAVTSHLEARSDHWCSIKGWSGEQVAGRIRSDGIDILIDLAGHTAGNRLPVFAAKPAPVQVSWLGYPNTTGLRAMDYRITDAVADPVGEADPRHSETLARLPHIFLCYRGDPRAPAVTAPPFSLSGGITFGSFNNLSKTNPRVIAVWSRILHAVEGSRLFLKCRQLLDPGTREIVLRLFAEHGIGRDRLEFCGWIPAAQSHLETYGRLDIGLDPFPYNGTTTTCEALWMGVPVVCLRGDRHAARVGASILTCIDMEELIAETEAEYVDRVVALAGDQERLALYRSTLRRRLAVSPLTDSAGFAARMENAYREMWRAWCARKLAPLLQKKSSLLTT
ncbi:MAG: tetratricopeptide repeat protein [Deltaproteobacteria bacterium]|nr:tetratricopeptide repeat protein [Deltaproteobacteria bacterium]